MLTQASCGVSMETDSLASGEEPGSERMMRAAGFLLGKQHDDGGWGESVESCRAHQWIDMESQVIQTAWAVMALVKAAPADPKVMAGAERGVRFLVSRQELSLIHI